jgi:putative methyltransferase (TIGR04325 family)
LQFLHAANRTLGLNKAGAAAMEPLPTLETFPDYGSALKACGGDGYTDRELADVTVFKTRAILAGDLRVALYPPNAEATLTALHMIPAREPRVLDFGGSFGPHYFLAKQCLPRRYRWAIVETELVASLGKEFANDELRFFTSIDAAVDWLGGADLVHASGSLQCMPRPSAVLSSLVGVHAPALAILRTAIALGRECVTVQSFLLSGSDPVFGLPDGVEDRVMKFPRVFIAQQDFVSSVDRFYRIVAHTRDDREGPLVVEDVSLCLGDNFIFARRDF